MKCYLFKVILNYTEQNKIIMWSYIWRTALFAALAWSYKMDRKNYFQLLSNNFSIYIWKRWNSKLHNLQLRTLKFFDSPIFAFS